MRQLDLRGLIIPFTLLKASSGFKEIQVGETLEMLWGETDSTADLFKVLPEASYELIVMEALHGEDSGVRIQLKKEAH